MRHIRTQKLEEEYRAGDVGGGAIGRDMTEMIYETRTSASRQTENPVRKFFWLMVGTRRTAGG